MATIERRPVPGYEGFYEVSSDGRVFSLPRTSRRGLPGRELRQSPTSKGYPTVAMSVNGRRTMAYVHRLVAMAFLENPDGLKEVNHIDGNRKNARVENLEWCSPTGNRLHAYHVSKSFRMPNRGKLSYELAEKIRAERTTSGTAELAKRYGVKDNTIRRIVNRQNYAHPPREIVQSRWAKPVPSPAEERR